MSDMEKTPDLTSPSEVALDAAIAGLDTRGLPAWVRDLAVRWERAGHYGCGMYAHQLVTVARAGRCSSDPDDPLVPPSSALQERV